MNPNNLKRLQFVFKNKDIKTLISSYSSNDEETIEGIKEFWEKYKMCHFVPPSHSAVTL